MGIYVGNYFEYSLNTCLSVGMEIFYLFIFTSCFALSINPVQPTGHPKAGAASRGDLNTLRNEDGTPVPHAADCNCALWLGSGCW